MLNPAVNISEVPRAIQLALGPVFLLTGIAGMPNVMTGRLARIIDASLKWVIGLLFTGAMLVLALGLAFFLQEVQLATRTVRIPVSGVDS